ncbi:androgen-induced gene 1 protein-like isoform X2 [Agrilus planipennis]|uniref:Androgen-induced gene 1 protein-like isoform X2 n=1 Tax=Agrilus planipennis TaxID=224129 RepID=A0A1W4X583_AGRPL|nr:androgen-induced gene 1 protein-like isoform X2 [Agrilus planipennis]
MASVRTVLHFLAFVHFGFGCFYDWMFVNVPVQVHPMGSAYGGKLKFLTFWDALLQTLLFAVCTLNDIKGTNEIEPNVKPTIRKFKDKLLACLGFPLSMFVGLTFWAIYAVDRELVFPRALDAFFPTWLNHVMHTNIMIFVLIEMATSYCRYPSRKFGLTVVTIFMACYLVWLHVIHAKTGLWVYPILDVLNLPLRIVFFASLLGLTIGLYIVGENLNAVLWAKEIKKIKVDKKKKH